MIKDGNTHAKILFDEVLFLKSDNVYVEVCTEKRKYVVRMQLTDLLNEFPEERFIRVHRSYVINKDKISEYTIAKVLIGELEIPVSKAYAKEIKKHLS